MSAESCWLKYVSVSFNGELCYQNSIPRKKIPTKLYSVPLKLLYDLHEKAKASSYLDSSTPEYRLVCMIIDVAHHRFFGPPSIIDECELKKPRKFLHLKFDNKGIDAVNINNFLNHENVQSCIPPYFKMKSTPCISYRYFHYCIQVIQLQTNLPCLDVEQLRQNPPKCSCSSSPFNYSPDVHNITGDVNIVQNENLRPQADIEKP
jgi:hypothetical protein